MDLIFWVFSSCLQTRLSRIYLNILIVEYVCHKYLFRHFLVSFFDTNVFGHSFVPNYFVRIYSDINSRVWKIFEYFQTFIQFSMLISIWTFLCVKFLIWIYSDICSYRAAKVIWRSPILSWPRIMFSKRVCYDFFNCHDKCRKIECLEEKDFSGLSFNKM